jgi:hypothetical protein
MPICFSGWSKAEDVTGEPNLDYSLYLDIYYTDGTWSYGHILTFTTGTHDWEFREAFVVPEKPIAAVNIHCLLRTTHTGTAWFDDIDLWEMDQGHDRVRAAINSGFWDECGRYRHEAYGAGQVPWCSGAAGCRAFIVNPDPDIDDPVHTPNKGDLEWNQAVKEVYTDTPGLPESKYAGLDGEYIDSFLARATVMGFRSSHFAAIDTPLTFHTGSHRVSIPQVFATVEFARWVAGDVQDELDKWMMGNWILRDLPWGADLFDVLGTETNWLQDGELVPESDATLSYRRTLAYQRPYGLLMNTNFLSLTHDLVERYFQVSLFYGFYPSMLSQDAATDPYWEDPVLYNRDRELFKTYVPLIRRLNRAGWQPLAYATTSDPNVYIERFGEWPDLYFTLRNTADMTTTVGITIQGGDLGLPDVPLCAKALLSNANRPLSGTAPTRIFTLTVAPQASEAVSIDCKVFLPLIFKRSGQHALPRLVR